MSRPSPRPRPRIRRRPTPGAAATLPLLLAPALAGALGVHGLELELASEGPYRVVTATYAAGTPAPDADVVVEAPGGDTEGAWQTGRTDPMGRFVFAPDRDGEWRVTVDDGQGHRAVLTFSVTPASEEGGGEARVVEETPPHDHDAPREALNAPPVPAEGPGGGGRFWQLATGLSLIAGLTGMAYGVTARR